ncbi:MAG: AmpG family muropeptide MFS transporter [Deltaproteobacteria bacterium]|nr:AmpG family muropeptide MFS transporter [Deltaproteobacteria bacterium]
MCRVIFSRRMLICIFTGIASGMPLYVLIQLVPAWLRDQGVDLGKIGLFSLVSIPYTWKFVWSPLMDRYVPPFLGRRRGWILITQVALLISIGMLALCNPQQSLSKIAGVVFAIALFSASQDIVLDAYRRELLPDRELGLGNSFFVNAYRLSSLVPGSLSLILADILPWSQVHLITAAFMLIGIVTTLWMPEVASPQNTPRSLREAIVEPFREFFNRSDMRSAVLILVFMLLYKLGDNMATALATPFYLDMGFSKTEIGAIAKVAALWSSIFGGFIGGVVLLYIGINKGLWLFGAFQMVAILGFAVLAEVGHSTLLLFFVVSFEYLGVGLGTAAFVAFIARNTNKRFSATQMALLSSIMVIPRTFANASTGYLIEWLGYTYFFILCSLLALPGMLLLCWVAPWGEKLED